MGAGNYSGSKITASKIAGSKTAGPIIAGRDYSSSNIAAEIIAALFLNIKTSNSWAHVSFAYSLHVKKM